ncbi:5-(carboxyamino)imidazole ribonucleotide synthase [Shouchella lehensis]|uniref:N5-carboxyaminoimidazole ribonucleotide synthase n=1 Tax=Shouchella lehensis G1 TaxID=1246626 RepID=A0A060LZ86_9BACI|nr:5-(carboxyamino)imidazole ribonucleotide synthase [Shouchella lehensis]AIC93598.1 N5-carboxyaminoimidazole ribonucleotide synthase [Shouchella lehensis G1]
MTIVKPGSTIGIIGGGQLGRMMALSAKAMGYRIAVLDPTPDAPCAQVADHVITASYDDYEACKELASMSDVITYEFENIDEQAAAQLWQVSDFPQGYKVLATTQHRLKEKQALRHLHVPVAPFAAIQSLHDLEEAVAITNFPAVVKTCRGGYDGKGQKVVHTWDELTDAAEHLLTYGELVIEAFVPFTCEVSVIATKSRNGEISVFPLVENEHQDSILHRTIAPARVSEVVEKEAKQIAMQIVEGLDVVGTLAVEMFVTDDNKLVVNELAPRPHNSGHYTIEACKTSQFEQHIRAICGLPLGETTLLTPAVMENLLGEHVAPLMERLNELNRISLHLYGKKEAKWKRKMGHLTVLGEDSTRCLQILDAFWEKKMKVLEEIE